MRKALTVGELLVTMAIIGVIAALVLPGFMKDYHNKIYTARLKKAYEIIGVAVNQACMDSNVSYFSHTPYVNQAKSPDNKLYQQEFLDKYFKKTNNTGTPFADEYRDFSSNTTTSIVLDATKDGSAKLAGGEAIAFTCDPASTDCEFRVDVNGPDGPNISGRDLFTIRLTKRTNRIYDLSASNCGGTDANGNIQYVRGGVGCMTRIMEANWEMKY